MSTDYAIGLISGTSMDAIDAVLVDLSNGSVNIIETLDYAIPDSLRTKLITLCQPGENEIERMGQADTQLGVLFADAVKELLKKSNVPADQILAIGSHGQTIRHCPVNSDSGIQFPFTLQIGDANQIAEHTGITTVADFRRRDMAAGGQGAPLVPAFHAAVFTSSEHTRVILNIGGIANITVLPMEDNTPIFGFDTGPGNGLMDAWIQINKQQAFDKDGAWAASGNINSKLLTHLLSDPYFKLPPPKSTGRELFHLGWLEKQVNEAGEKLSPNDIQATLCEFTAASIANAINQHGKSINEVIVCGGGARNGYLMKRLQVLLDSVEIKSTAELGIPPEWVEATAFAWLAKETLSHRPGNVPSVTGANHPVVLGGIYPAH